MARLPVWLWATVLAAAVVFFAGGCAAPAINPRQPANENEVLTDIQQLTHGFSRTSGATFSPDMRWIAFQAAVPDEAADQVFVAPLQRDGQSVSGLGRPIRVTPRGSVNGGVCFSPDGNSLLIASTGSQTTADDRSPASKPTTWPTSIRLFRSDGWEPAVIAAAPGTIVDLARFSITPANTIATQPAWSGDGKWIAYASQANGNVDVIIARADGSEPVSVTHSPALDGYPAFSPDGLHLLYASSRNEKSPTGQGLDLFTCQFNFDSHGNVTGASHDRPVTQGAISGRSGSWGPGGGNLFYSVFSDNRSTSRLCVMRSDGTLKTDITKSNNSGSWFDFHPVCSPDGKRLMWISNRSPDGTPQIFIANFTMPPGV